MTRFKSVRPVTQAKALRKIGTEKSIRGNSSGNSPERRSARRLSHTPVGMRTSPIRKTPGRTRKKITPT